MKILKHSCEMLKFEFVYLHEEMKSLMSFVENEIQFEISRIFHLVSIIFFLHKNFLMILRSKRKEISEKLKKSLKTQKNR